MTGEIAVIETGLYMPSPGEAKAAMDALQEMMQVILVKDDYATIAGKEHRKRTAYAKLRRVFAVTVTVIKECWEDLGDGEFGCLVSVRATFPDGRYEDGDGYCDSIEMRRGRIDPSRHNVRAKAHTRAKNRATADLLGTGDVSAEEMAPGSSVSRQRGASPRQRQPQPQQSGNGDKWLVDWGAFSNRAMSEILTIDSELYYGHQKHVVATLQQELGDPEAIFWKDGTALAVPEGHTAESLYAILVEHAKGKENPAE